MVWELNFYLYNVPNARLHSTLKKDENIFFVLIVEQRYL